MLCVAIHCACGVCITKVSCISFVLQVVDKCLGCILPTRLMNMTSHVSTHVTAFEVLPWITAVRCYVVLRWAHEYKKKVVLEMN